MPIKNDFDFVSDLAHEFFHRPHVKKVLRSIDESAMTGWEKWLQIEFASFLSSHVGVKAWWRESKYDLDQRLLDSRKQCAVDFLVREKWKQTHIAIEIKQALSPAACIRAMLRDKRKIAAIRGAKFDIRSVWCLGVHRFDKSDEIRRLTNYYADKVKTQVKPSLFATARIGYTQYSYSLF